MPALRGDVVASRRVEAVYGEELLLCSSDAFCADWLFTKDSCRVSVSQG